MDPKISIIMPCFNQGGFVDEAVDSVLAQTFQDFEIIVINDGSTDDQTNKILSAYDRPKTRVLHTSNQGPAAARNNGIREAKGEYILPLDADDRIGSTYLERASKILDADPGIGIVYCLAEYFGTQKGSWRLPDYNLKKMLMFNLIFCSALFRRSDWEQVGGYKTNLQHGLEDWDFWLSLIEKGRGIYRIPEVCFYYRIKNTSRSTLMDMERRVAMHLQLIRNHPALYIDNLAEPLLRLYYRIKFSKAYRILQRVNLPSFIANTIRFK